MRPIVPALRALACVVALTYVIAGVLPATAQTTVFRATDLDLRDPHAFAFIVLLGCWDITDNVPLADSFNEQLANALNTDSDLDGWLDLNPLIGFMPLDQGALGGDMFVHFGNCTPPAGATVCEADPMSPVQMVTYTNGAGGNCLEPQLGTTSGYTPPIALPGAPCFVSEPFDAHISLVGVQFVLESTQVAGTYVNTPATGIMNGLIQGFLSEAAADNVILDASIPVVGGLPLSAVLPGGSNNCAAGDDRDLGPDGQTLGWWMYLNFEASEVPYDDVTGVDGPGAPTLALDFRPVAPNPFNPRTAFSFTIPSASHVELGVYDLAGRPVVTLVDGIEAAGEHTIRWDGRSEAGAPLASGIYFSRLRYDGTVLTQKLVLAK